MDLIDLSFSSNNVCACLEKSKLKNASEDFLHKIINIKESKYEKKPKATLIKIIMNMFLTSQASTIT